jgi:glycosyltransferase involved in cell wall biosynthesis
MVEDGRNGLLAAPGSPEELAGCIARLLRDRELATELGERGRRTVLDRFTYRRTVAETAAVYHELLDSRSAP